ncbi:kinase-like domain-containing protein, partial [Gaertneriomyces semiglobifer]
MTASGSSLPVTASQDEAAYALLNTTIETRALGTLQLVKILGMGSFAVVFEGVALGNPSVKYAVKTLFKQALTPQQLAVQTLESTYHAQLSTPPHPNIVTLFEAIHTEDHLFLVLEFCDDDLFGLIEKRDGLSPKEAKIVMRQLVNGLRYIHSRGVYHRDLKPENVLVKYPSSYRSSSEHVVVKFTDFGLSTTERFTTEFGVGSVRYMAPEVLTPSDTPYDAEKNDVWALGVLFINLMTTQNPWSEPKHQDMLY